MAIMVRDLPPEERPREKLLAYGPSGLSNAELLAILLRSGTRKKSVLRIAEEILARIKEQGLVGMVHISVAELAKIDGVGKVKAATLQAAIELARRLAVQQSAKIQMITGPEDVARYAMPHYRFEQKEHFAVLLLNTKNHVISMPEVSVGSLSASVVHPREVFRAAIDHAAAAMILLHNHPSGDPTPSREDIAVTERLVKAGKIMDIPVLDHVVLGRDRFISLKEKGLLQG
ncbi:MULTISPECIES: RadC family protein [Selenomonas]|jgi:DNA repair protein RadC|uniref:DNA repair protein RadC n=1 Tax=Selenomonas ruminantium TaxID=971 RepID=A0A1K1QU96_SELRU|nr:MULTISPECIES: DNA repair protein RadC [Selenomonas]MBE6086279.1 JAB domain-containing protein [Selenomonas ruminantium]SEA33950.1 DNA repair protein RadC [Selenomonas ruminantium]SFB14647.1 DNA repair protein RadC [Selenomonas ruminantium]SFW63522.1 DNA repair protein RadC [Selenomonas ruminantium]